ncbi:hypothetical protein JZ751_000252 [Albula glossodonta]|uniref:Uncharacterized protein n=1 Tax=Albula glossodonta TaxID=121402 RepID=A0A8T2PVU8_9TELE|nr:hypothetical protein JZ751_000252 [Albula glossodonta]
MPRRTKNSHEDNASVDEDEEDLSDSEESVFSGLEDSGSDSDDDGDDEEGESEEEMPRENGESSSTMAWFPPLLSGRNHSGRPRRDGGARWDEMGQGGLLPTPPKARLLSSQTARHSRTTTWVQTPVTAGRESETAARQLPAPLVRSR